MRKGLLAGLVAGACAVGCSLLADLDGLAGKDPTSSLPDAQADAPRDDATPPDGGLPDGAVDSGPYAPRYQRSLALTNESNETLPAGRSTCFRASAVDIVDLGAVGKVKPDLSDVRLFARGSERKRVIDMLSGGAISFCFRLEAPIAPGATDTGYVLRYGDPNANVPAPAEADVFDFWDGFDGTTLLPKWLTTGNPTVAGGKLTLPQGTPSGITTVAGTDGVPTAAVLELRVRVVDPTSAGQPQDDAGSVFHYWFGFQHQGDFDAYKPWTLFVARSPSTISAEHVTTEGDCSTGCGGPAAPQVAAYRIYTVVRRGNLVVLAHEDGTSWEGAGSNGDMSILIRSYLVSSDVEVDWVRARSYATVDPTPEPGPEENMP